MEAPDGNFLDRDLALCTGLEDEFGSYLAAVEGT